MKIKCEKTELIIYFVVAIILLSPIILPSNFGIIVGMFGAFIIAITGWNAYTKKHTKTICAVLTAPVFLSCVQNIFLGIASAKLSSLECQVLLSVHFLTVIAMTMLFMMNHKIKNRAWPFLLLIVVMIQSILLAFLYPSPITSFLSSFRNIVSCICVYLVANSYGKFTTLKKLFGVLNPIIVFVVMFGFFEYFVGLRVWESLNIEELWNLKGIGTNLWGIPPNWYSSEYINGQQVRRMVSSFADPVNLGTFLFAAFLCMWYQKKYILMIIISIAAILTMSKGALLSFLIFLVVYTWYKDRTKLMVPVMASAVLAVGLAFISFSSKSSTGSVFVHIAGFLKSFSSLISHPFGQGVGNVGVLSTLFNRENVGSQNIIETGIGMIIAQLGIIGLGCYIFFFFKLIKNSLRIPIIFCREKILLLSLILAFLANAIFNEVALSPNSCGIYFLVIGLLQNEEVLSKQRMELG